jgi:transcriptional regulator with XRE-family HTH domain
MANDEPDNEVGDADLSDTEAPNPIGEWVLRERLQKKWTQQQLAEEAGISQPSVSFIERGKTLNPQKPPLDKLAKALGSSVPARLAREASGESEVVGLEPLVDFDPHDDAALPRVPGVYDFYDVTDRPVYVGRAIKEGRTIRTRVKEHNDRFWFKPPVVSYAAYVEVHDEDLCNQVESVLIRFLKRNALLNKIGDDRS